MSIIDKKLIFEASEALYSTATDPKGWAQFLDLLRAFAPEIKVIIQHHEANSGVLPTGPRRHDDPSQTRPTHSVPVEPAASQPRTGAGGATRPTTAADRPGAGVDRGVEAGGSRAPDGHGNSFGVVLTRNSSGTVSLACHLPATLDPEIVASLHMTLDALTPLMVRAARLSQRQMPEAAVPDPRGVVLEHLSTAVFCLDDAGRCIYANFTADRMLQAGDILRKGPDDRLHFTEAAADARLQQTRTGGAGKRDMAPSFPVTDRRKGVTLSVTVITDLSDHHRAMTPAIEGQVAALMMITDPHGIAVPPAGTLRSIYGLTRAEATVAERLARGEPLSRIADLLGVKESTVRTQVKSIMDKMGVSRQSDVVRTVLGVAGGFVIPAGSG